MILAIVLSAIVLFGWSFISERWFPTANEPSTRIVEGKQVAVPKPEADPAADTPIALRNRALVLRETPRVRIETPALRGSINLRGARIDDLVLTRHTESMTANSPPIRLFSPAGAPDAYFGGFGWTGQGLTLPGPNTVWTASGDRLAPSRPVTLSWANGQGQRFEIRLAIDENYMFTAEQVVANGGAGAVAARPYALVSRYGVPKDPDSWTIHIGPMGVFNGSANYGPDFGENAEKSDKRFSTTGGWVR